MAGRRSHRVEIRSSALRHWVSHVGVSIVMYEENLKPLSHDDFAKIFADLLVAIERNVQATPPDRIAPGNVVRWANTRVQSSLAAMCRRLLLPGSELLGVENLIELTNLALQGRSCILCLNHRSNLDVPTLCTLLEDQTDLDLFRHIIWIAGRKLEEDVGLTGLLVQGFNRVIVTPRSWLQGDHADEEVHEAHLINLAAHRAIHELRGQGWVFALFPGATRLRPGDESTAHAIEETDSYLKHFEFMVLGRIDGCTLPVSRDRDLTHEIPTLDLMRYSFGRVQRTDAWRADAASRFAQFDQRTASARAIVEDIAATGPPAKELR